MTLIGTARTRLHAVIDPILTTRHDMLPPPDDGTVDPLLAYFQWRGWTIVDRDTHTTAVLSYPESFHGALGTVDRRSAAPDDNLQELEVELVLRGVHWVAHFSSCGVLIGCDRHRSIPVTMGVHALPFTAVLGILEFLARRRRPRDIAHCLVFGACSSHSIPSGPCLLRQPAADHRSTLHAVHHGGEGAE
ncbi:hypothetical protein DMH01_14935 [Amycolatopsis sp. WAC 04182]|uniref:hypothetical protein n=1 Tax=Amycolatopsis sp. WAC 04182 TaxID=2203198 RepID=UPI000F7824B2|nr:hypothetical protein [Amycolatopsis sp. WAC 04182]RSN60592.1 hypothetical protein DMH01_14935 [Amycolatopsis sp. WAC 04182]